jgi:hypothetical protein
MRREDLNPSIGFDRRIRLAWLDRTAEIVGEALRATRPGESPDPAALAAVRAALHRALAGEIQGTDARRKTVNILTRIWLRVPEAHRALRDEALSLWPRVPDAGRLWLHWGLALLAYPFFRDVATTVGRLLRAQDRFTLAQVQRELVARWGERTTLDYAAPRAISSLADWGVLAPSEDGRGIYRGTPARVSPHPELPVWLIEAALRSSPGTTLSLYDLLHLPALFPFRLDIGLNQLYASPRFLILHNGDNEPLVALRTM